MEYFHIYGAPLGLFMGWEYYGAIWTERAQAAEILGWLLTAGSSSYTWSLNDQSGTPVIPVFPTVVGPQQPGGGGFPKIPTSPTTPQWPWGNLPGLSL